MAKSPFTFDAIAARFYSRGDAESRSAGFKIYAERAAFIESADAEGGSLRSSAERALSASATPAVAPLAKIFTYASRVDADALKQYACLRDTIDTRRL